MKGLTYKKSGVDIKKADSFLDKAKPLISSTAIPGALGKIGGFGGLFEASFKGYKEPVLVSSADGVGTKLKIAFLANKHDTVGIDLVAMNVNDILCVGARPLFFLDYIATSQIKTDVLTDVVKGIARGCKEAGCALVGGETAEMPSIYKKGEYDLAGFCVGVVDKKDIIDKLCLRPGDRIVGIESSGLHSNGFSLVRKVFTAKEMRPLSRELLKPTRIYIKPVLGLLKNVRVKAIAHVTGGAYYNKVSRILTKNLGLIIDSSLWKPHAIFGLIQKKGRISTREMFATFNMGIGMVLAVDKRDVNKAINYLSKYKLKAWDIGEVVKGSGKVKIV